ncbi:hypothetical protein C1645_837919 [Glomus cerebriforme]|uniref:Uncharacterized protein n=1 Tax=Glomus cerebriforme TaxID=658196 RepID=A0A397S7V2_9GLOM|nr:hypothetical protein C1645_837919 [Glomus cerebriforme]
MKIQKEANDFLQQKIEVLETQLSLFNNPKINSFGSILMLTCSVKTNNIKSEEGEGDEDGKIKIYDDKNTKEANGKKDIKRKNTGSKKDTKRKKTNGNKFAKKTISDNDTIEAVSNKTKEKILVQSSSSFTDSSSSESESSFENIGEKGMEEEEKEKE